MHRALVIAFALFAAPAAAQHGGQHGADAHRQPYAGLQERRVKALSAEQEAELRTGRGMALALAAELNGYPGPMHVLEHAEALRLTPAQRDAAEVLRARMASEAQAIGTRMIMLEEELDALFRGGAPDPGGVAALTAALGALGGRLRETHLAAHVAMRGVLDPAQRDAYARLRGYAPR